MSSSRKKYRVALSEDARQELIDLVSKILWGSGEI